MSSIVKATVNNWHYVSVGLAVLFAVMALFIAADARQIYLLASASLLCLHFFEEFGYPGGFPLMGVRLLLGSDETDSTKWDCNNLNSMLGNWGALFLIYLIPLLIPQLEFLTIAAIILSIAEVIMHLFLFNVKQRSIYNPGMITGVFGLGVILIYYLFNGFDLSSHVWSDYVIGFIYFAIAFWLCFRSPMYWRIGRIEGYPLSKRAAYGFEMDKIE